MTSGKVSALTSLLHRAGFHKWGPWGEPFEVDPAKVFVGESLVSTRNMGWWQSRYCPICKEWQDRRAPSPTEPSP